MLDSDGTVIISISPKLSRGSLLTLKKAQDHGKPVLHTHSGTDASKRLAEFIAANSIQALNVAGPRASTEPGIARFVRMILENVWRKSMRA